MLRFAIFLFCASLIGALPAPKNATRTFFSKSKVMGPRIINGQKASPGQIPYQVGLFIDGDDGTWFCGGSLISNEWILTAGHCVDGATGGVVVSGSTDVYGGLVTDLSEGILHGGYDGDNLQNDIGLLKTATPLTFDANTGAIGLSSQTLGDGTEVTVSGWGLTSDDGETISEDLNYVSLVTISNSQCSQYYGPIGNEMVCATSGSSQIKSTCSGDSGGPVTINSGTEHVAIVSFVSAEGCESGAPSGYTRTAYYRDWIQVNTGV